MREIAVFVAVALLLVGSAISYAYIVLFLIMMGIMFMVISLGISFGNGVKWVFTTARQRRFRR